MTYPKREDQRWKAIPTSLPGMPPAYKWNTVPYSELAMHVRAAGKPIESAIVTENGRYAYVLTKDGEVYDGLPHELMVPALAEWADKNARAGEEMADKLASMLDGVADSLESKGFLKEAEEIDVVSNTIDAAETADVNRRI